MRHPVAKLRSLLRLTQPEFAKFVGCSESTIQAIEMGPARLKLSEEIAFKISTATNASLQWLLAGDASAPALDRMGRPWTEAAFQMSQSDSWRANEQDRAMRNIAPDFVHLASNLLAVLQQCAERPSEYQLVQFRMREALNRIMQDHGIAGRGADEDRMDEMATVWKLGEAEVREQLKNYRMDARIDALLGLPAGESAQKMLELAKNFSPEAIQLSQLNKKAPGKRRVKPAPIKKK